MSFESTAIWQPIDNPDITKRTPEEWAKIYNIKLLEPIKGWWSEYEWAYNMMKLKYIPSTKNSEGYPDWELIEEKELRAQFLYRDLYMGADLGEKEVLKTKYIETQWIRNNTMRV